VVTPEAKRWIAALGSGSTEERIAAYRGLVSLGLTDLVGFRGAVVQRSSWPTQRPPASYQCRLTAPIAAEERTMQMPVTGGERSLWVFVIVLAQFARAVGSSLQRWLVTVRPD